MDELQKTEKVIAKILSALMERGIQRGMVDLSVELDDELKPFVSACFYWLEAEGIVRARNTAETNESFSVVSPSLTSLGFQLLGSEFKLVGGDKKLAEIVTEVANEDHSYSQLGDFFGGLLGGFTKSLGS